MIHYPGDKNCKISQSKIRSYFHLVKTNNLLCEGYPPCCKRTCYGIQVSRLTCYKQTNRRLQYPWPPTRDLGNKATRNC